MHYEEAEISDINYLRGTVIPFGTRVQLLAVGKGSVEFQAVGHPAITLRFEHGAGRLTLEEYIERVFPVDDPRARLPAAPAGSQEARNVDKLRRSIGEGTVSVGMTREQVLMAIGYPPAHRTPSLDASPWTYWANRGDTFKVYFKDDRVSRLRRQGSELGRRRRRS